MAPQLPRLSDGDDVLAAVRTFAAEAGAERHDRQRSRRLRRDDFDRLAAAGVVRTGLPRDDGGLFDDGERSIRPLCEILRTLAAGDASLALVVAMLAFEGMLRGTERSGGRHAILAKTAIAELAEDTTTRSCRVMGGGSYARHSPFGFWAQDVRALGFLRPPWALAHDSAYGDAWASEA